MTNPRTGVRRRSPQEELESRLKKLLGRAAKSLGWKEAERSRWGRRVESGLQPTSSQARRLSEHLFRLAGKLNGPATVAEARRLAAVLRILDEVPGAVSGEEALRIAVTGLRDGLEFDSATGFLYEAEESRLIPSVVVGSHVDLIPDFAFDHGVGISSWVAKTRRPVLLAALRRDAEVPDSARPSSFLSIPMIEGEDLVGVLNLAHRRPGAFAPADREFVLLAGRFVAPVLCRAGLPGSPLLGQEEEMLASRRQLEVRLLEAEHASRRGQQSFALVGLCLQGPLPDGRARGVPRELGHAVDGYLNRLRGEGGLACRLGPEAIAVLLPHVTSQEAWRVASELREHLVTECRPEQNGRSLQVASVVYPHDAASAPEVMERVEHILGLDGGRPLPAATRVACG